MSHNRIRIKFESFDHNILDRAAVDVVNTAKKTGARVYGPIPMPTEINKYTVLRGPHIDKKSREQFEIRKYKRIIDILDSNPETIDSLMKLDLPSGVSVEIKV